MTLRQKTISGFFWSFIDNFLSKFIHFLFGIILARLIEPADFGLIGMLIFFTSVSQTFVNSGFSQALIRKKNCTNVDLSTVFFFNILISVLIYLVLFFAAGGISNFYKEPRLELLLKVLAMDVVINSFRLIQETILTKNINFKLQTKVSALSSILSGLIGVYFAYNGWGVWSLIWKTITQSLISASLLWIFNSWKPNWIFSIRSLKTLLPFSINVLFTSLISTVYRNTYYLIIGKFFSPVELGYYTRAEQFRNLPSQNINSIMQRVSFPVLSNLQNDNEKLKSNYRKLIRSTIYITSILLIGMASISERMVLLLIGSKWAPVIPYLQLLCVAGVFHPIHSLNSSILLVKGRSDLHLKLESVFILLSIPVIVTGIMWGIKVLIYGITMHSMFCWIINSLYAGRLIDYTFKEQIKDITPSIIIAITMGFFVFSINRYLSEELLIGLLTQVFAGVLFVLILSLSFKIDPFLEIRNVIIEFARKRK